MRYACIGGKRVRAFLVMESARLFGVEGQRRAARRRGGRGAARL